MARFPVVQAEANDRDDQGLADSSITPWHWITSSILLPSACFAKDSELFPQTLPWHPTFPSGGSVIFRISETWFGLVTGFIYSVHNYSPNLPWCWAFIWGTWPLSVPSYDPKSKLFYVWETFSQSVWRGVEHPCGNCDQILLPVGMLLSSFLLSDKTTGLQLAV
jgi:hypothetical protein